MSPEDKCIIEISSEFKDRSMIVIELAEEDKKKSSLINCPHCGNPIYRIMVTGECYCFRCKKYIIF
ncbi:MAG: hypothetical protein QXT98_01315 [Archaeoglobaceae archaeon]